MDLPGLHILSQDRPKLSMSFLTQSHQVFFGHPLSNSFNFLSKPSQPTLFDHQTDWFQS